jgi:SAM-dependent methyltransferase
VPKAHFVRGDFADLDFPDATFDGVAALYSLTHVPREAHEALFARIARWLTPGGAFPATLSVGGTEDWIGEFIGVTMFFSGYDADTSRHLIREAGFDLIADEVVEQQEPGEGVARFLWIIAAKRFANPS